MNHRQIPGDTIPWQKRSNLIAAVQYHDHLTVAEALVVARVSMWACVNSEWLNVNLERFSYQLELDGDMKAALRWTELNSLMLRYRRSNSNLSEVGVKRGRSMSCEGRVR